MQYFSLLKSQWTSIIIIFYVGVHLHRQPSGSVLQPLLWKKGDSMFYIDRLISMFLKILIDDIASFLPQLTKRRNSSSESNNHTKHVSKLASVMSCSHSIKRLISHRR
ncbi:hypothetical protein CEXT_113351 [Caerostris extrusa]|uniref:Uncharacterized protein n=1 Tax=Caerostris extrusa TaxID=172846 RepID=A0AAV4MCL0_CAEEX|nr:hypothetical protein CEXT_113351 [Caerostris extrusa]